MKVGIALTFANPSDAQTDLAVYRQELALADLAEPLGFDSIWGVEHHFTNYQMSPDVLQFLSFMAGRTNLDLGSMVVVLPWHDPVRVAEEVSVLDNLSNGRVILGLGRGLGRVEFEGLRIPMDESRGRFMEGARIVLQGLETGYVEYDGEFFKQPRRAIRPAPFKSFRGRAYAASVSPESAPLVAELGLGILIIPQKPWDQVAEDLNEYRAMYRQIHGSAPPPTVVACWVFCDPDPARAREMGPLYIGKYYHSVLSHYDLRTNHLSETKGYEYYSKVSDSLIQHGPDHATQFFCDLQVYGTPAECYDKIMAIRSRVGCDTIVGIFSYGSLPFDESQRNARLFAAEVLPRLKILEPVGVVGD